MDTSILRENPPEVTPYEARSLRALTLVEERADEITRTGRTTYLVPSSDGIPGHVYIVRYGGERESCDCPDAAYHPEQACKHLLAVGIRHASRRSGVKVRTVPAAVVGDPFAHAAKRRGCSRCYGGVVYIGVEHDGNEHLEAVPCRRCSSPTGVGDEDLR